MGTWARGDGHVAMPEKEVRGNWLTVRSQGKPAVAQNEDGKCQAAADAVNAAVDGGLQVLEGRGGQACQLALLHLAIIAVAVLHQGP